MRSSLRPGRPAAKRAKSYAADVITVVDYDPAWPGRFDGLGQGYAAAMDAAGVAWVAIEHVGSTSVPRLAAKPIIDCDIVVAEEDVVRGHRGSHRSRLRSVEQAWRPATMSLRGAGPTGWNKHLRDSRGIPVAIPVAVRIPSGLQQETGFSEQDQLENLERPGR
jgi:GrpB-like predicted nucleotidyltransferase (UPF0157 family)